MKDRWLNRISYRYFVEKPVRCFTVNIGLSDTGLSDLQISHITLDFLSPQSVFICFFFVIRQILFFFLSSYYHFWRVSLFRNKYIFHSKIYTGMGYSLAQLSLYRIGSPKIITDVRRWNKQKNIPGDFQMKNICPSEVSVELCPTLKWYFWIRTQE